MEVGEGVDNRDLANHPQSQKDDPIITEPLPIGSPEEEQRVADQELLKPRPGIEQLFEESPHSSLQPADGHN